MTDPSLTGGCLCGRVRFALSTPATTAGYCHCTRCQRRTGTSSSANAQIDGRTFQLVAGAEFVKSWRHPDGGFEKCFCGECGAHLFSRNPEDHTQVAVRLGAFDGDPGVRPSWRGFTDYAAVWEPIPDDGLVRFGEARPRTDPHRPAPPEPDRPAPPDPHRPAPPDPRDPATRDSR